MRSGGTGPESGGTAIATVRVWDLPTRLFHWTLVLLVGMAWVSRKYGDEGLVWHTWNGYAVLILIVWRLLWGIVGSSTSRLSGLLARLAQAPRYGIDFVLGRPRHFLGHNPLGGAMVMALLGVIGLIGGLGLFAYDDHDSNAGGPLASKVADATWAAAAHWHHKLFDGLLLLVALHVTAAFLYLAWKRENLVRPMVTGVKAAGHYEDAEEARLAGGVRAIVCLAVAVAIVLGGIMLAGGKVF